MAKFKVGDRVKIVGFSNLEREATNPVLPHVGDIAKVVGIGSRDFLLCSKENGHRCHSLYFPESSLEPAPRFAVGDEVRVKAGVNSKTHKDLGNGFVKQMDKLLGQKMLVSCVEDGAFDCGDWTYDDDWLEPWNPAEEWDGSKWVAKKLEPLEFVKEWGKWAIKQPHIVINRHASGQLKPASNPHIHANYDDAKAEAKRLADAHKGEEFCVFGLKNVVKVEKGLAERLLPAFTVTTPQEFICDDGSDVEFTATRKTAKADGNILTLVYEVHSIEQGA